MTTTPELEFERLAAVDRPDFSHLTVAERREFMRLTSDLMFLRFGARGATDVTVTDHLVPVEGGQILARVYRPDGDGPFPGHLVLHGGGWWLGTVEEKVNDAICRDRASGARCVVVALEYRLAPEHPFPTGLNDCYDALAWMASNASALDIDPDVLSVGGGSAGGNLAAALCLKVRDEGGPRIAFALIEVPATDLSLERAGISLGEMEVKGISNEDLEETLGYYCPAPVRRDPLVSPLWASDLSGLPPTHVMTAELDPLRLQGEAYAEALAAAGVDATCSRIAGAIHANLYLTRVSEVSKAWRAETIDKLVAAHHATVPAR